MSRRIFFRKVKTLFAFFIISENWHGTGCWGPFLWKTRTCLSSISNTTAQWHKEPGPQLNIKMLSYQYRKSHCGDKTVVRSSYLHNGISYAGKTSLYWDRPQGISSNGIDLLILKNSGFSSRRVNIGLLSVMPSNGLIKSALLSPES